MTQVIIYKQDNGVISVVHPTQEAVEALGIEAIAAKDVPTGRPYKIMEETDLPANRSMRAGWTVDDAVLTDGVGA